MSKWISVKDRLPENREEVLCYTDYNERFIVSFINNMWVSNIIEDFYLDNNVTHWQPLPKPPIQR